MFLLLKAIRSLSILFILFLFNSESISSEAGLKTSFKAQATHIETGNYAYDSLTSLKKGQAGQWEFITHITNKSGQTLMIRKVAWNKDQKNYLPDARIEQPITGAFAEVKIKGENALMSFRKNSKTDLVTKTIKIEAETTNGGGMIAFVRSHLGEIIKGKTKSFNLIVPSRLSVIGFSASYETTVDYFGDRAKKIKLLPSNFIYRMFAPEIFFYFCGKKQLFCGYEGKVLVRDQENPEGMNIKLRFEKGKYPVFSPSSL